MQQAILEGRKALPHCRPNPPVGCVIVKNGAIISRGHTNEPGADHAEAMALRALGDEVQDIELYVTLEPCSFQGRTPSCARTMVNRGGVTKVYVGMLDPHPKNQGAGNQILIRAGIEVEVGVLGERVSEELSPFLIRE